MRWLLTGGAGYVGGHVAHALVAAGHEVVVLDDLSTGLSQRVPPGAALVQADVRDTAAVLRALREHAVEGVVHLAAHKSVEESVRDPLRYYGDNVGGFTSVLRACVQAGVGRVLLSSTAAVYGVPDLVTVGEDVPARPINAYGRSKLTCEWMLVDLARSTGTSAVSLRYFNVAGCAQPALGDTSTTNLVPLVFHAVDEGRRPTVFGVDYDTPDGSGVRDYIHVVDLAAAHVAAAERMAGQPFTATWNVGRGEGASVLEVVAVAAEVTGADLDPLLAERRPGDPGRLVADPARITAELGWTADLDLRAMIASAWEAHIARSGRGSARPASGTLTA